MRTKPYFKPRPPVDAPREPLRTFAELREETGLTHCALMQEIKATKVPFPQPEFRHRGRFVPAKTYYKPSEFRTWWAAHQAAKALAEAA